MYFDEYGNRDNPTVVLLHGAGMTDSFANQYCFSDCYHLVVPHLYGSGREVETPYDPQACAHGVAEIVMGLGKAGVSVVGHSVGAEVALLLVTQFEPLFLRAAFLSPWLCASERTIHRYARLAKLAGRQLQSAALVRLNARYWRLDEKQTVFLVDYAKKITPEQYRRFFERRVYLDRQPRYPYLTIPMLAVCGAREEREVRDSVRRLGERNKRCETLVLRGAGHDFPQRKAARLNPILLDFLQTAV